MLIGFIGACNNSKVLFLRMPLIVLRVLGWRGEPGDILELLFPSLQRDTGSALRQYSMVWIKKSKCWEENPNLKFPNDSLDTDCQILFPSCCATESQEKLKFDKETFHAICSDPNQEVCSGWGPLNHELPTNPWVAIKTNSTTPHSYACPINWLCFMTVHLKKKRGPGEGARLTCYDFRIMIFSLIMWM